MCLVSSVVAAKIQFLRSVSSSVGVFKPLLLAQSLAIHFLSEEIFLFEGLFEVFKKIL